jgi:ferredoxin-fold anticodon binding domain-containing protein
VVDAEVIDTYIGNQIPKGNISVTIRYNFIDEMAGKEVERLLKGFGILIR